MRLPIRIVQVFVAVLFIVSGLVKANDPIGLSYKMQEFFELWSEGFAPGSFIRNGLNFFHKTSLLLSVTMITLEILTGVALLIGWKKRFILWLLLALIIFFTFLTGYAYLSGKFTNCGCFGDCLPITPFTSFLKDILLLVMIIFLLAGQKYISPLFTVRTRVSILLITFFVSLGLQWYVLNYFPLADCLPFKKGNNIAEQMKPPVGSKPDSIVIRYIYEKEGKRYEWAASELPADFSSYKYIDRIDKVVRKGNADPPIKGFSLIGLSGEDSTQVVLQQEKAILVYAMDFKEKGWVKDINEVAKSAKAAGIPFYIASPNAAAGMDAFAKKGITGIQFFNADFTVVRTVARTTPTILFLNNGTITNKFSKHGIADARITVISHQKSN